MIRIPLSEVLVLNGKVIGWTYVSPPVTCLLVPKSKIAELTKPKQESSKSSESRPDLN